ncbi:hypothetical protein NHQ30_006164 [Ciborinia camelliae]|nr:hypothetical protein NHQ30_006164 [Ciborinia camelliae]
MVKFTSIALFLIAAIGSAQACTWCQCLFKDGSHCCLKQDDRIGNLDCTKACDGARRHDGTQTLDASGKVISEGTACNAGGKYKCLTIFNVNNHVNCH